MGKVSDRRMTRAAPEWEADPIDSGFDAPCRLCGELWPIETMGAGEEGRTCAQCESTAELAVQETRLVHETVWAFLLVDVPAIGLGLWLGLGVMPLIALFPALIWTVLALGHAHRSWVTWRNTRTSAALVGAGTSAVAALVSAAGVLLAVLV
ncbi:MAG: hypothetical protein ACI8PZ_002156 [Myxococcota bacterium]